MAIEPLSPTTISIRRNLLAASIAAITYKSFNVHIDSVSFLGTTTQFDKGAVAFLLIATTAWLTAHFFVRFVIDIKNRELTPHQIATQEEISKARLNLRQSAQSKLAQTVAQSLPDGFSFGAWQYPVTDRLFDHCERQNPSIDEQILNLNDERYTALTIMSRTGAVSPIRDPELYRYPTQIMLEQLKQYRRDYTYLRWRQRPTIASVGFLYFVSDYMIEGLIPIVLGIVALASMYDLVGLRWLSILLPNSVL